MNLRALDKFKSNRHYYNYITVRWSSSIQVHVFHFCWLMLIDRIGKFFVNIFVRFLLYSYITRGHTESLRDISSRAYLSNNQTLWHYISHHSGPILDVWWHVMAEIGLGVTFWFPTQHNTHASLVSPPLFRSNFILPPLTSFQTKDNLISACLYWVWVPFTKFERKANNNVEFFIYVFVLT